MKSRFLYLCLFVGFITTFLSCNKDDNGNVTYEQIVAVANRAGASLSFVNAETNTIESTLSIPNSEPMYVVYVPAYDKLYVGDRAAKKVHVVNPGTKQVEKSITVGNGVFHMWADGQGKQLWVSNDIDNTISVIDLSTNTVITTIPLGAKPHDVFLTKDGTKAYVSIIAPAANVPDSVYLFSTSNYGKLASKAVGKDPHLYHLSNTNQLFVPCQSGQLYKLDGSSLSETSQLALSGAHGVYSSPNQEYVYVTNISGSQLYSVIASSNMLKGSPFTSTSSTPHNITVNEVGDKMFVTHSGSTASTLSTYSINSGVLTTGTTVTVGTNPFGLVYYKRIK